VGKIPINEIDWGLLGLPIVGDAYSSYSLVFVSHQHSDDVSHVWWQCTFKHWHHHKPQNKGFPTFQWGSRLVSFKQYLLFFAKVTIRRYHEWKEKNVVVALGRRAPSTPSSSRPWAANTLSGFLDLLDFASTSVILTSRMQFFPFAQRPRIKTLPLSSLRSL
jgi:hypothetical protein